MCVYVEKSNQSDGVFVGNWRYINDFKLLFKINFIYFCVMIIDWCIHKIGCFTVAF